MNSKFRSPGNALGMAVFALLAVVLVLGGCAEFGFPAPPQPEPAQSTPPPAAVQPQVAKIGDALPSLETMMIAHHQQCESPASKAAETESAQQVQDLMKWLKRSCAVSDATLQPQLVALKQLRQRYVWPDAYAAWLDEWRRQLLRMQVLQQRAATAEAAQATMVKRLRAIERDLTTRP
jgi:hypothetical protein